VEKHPSIEWEECFYYLNFDVTIAVHQNSIKRRCN